MKALLGCGRFLLPARLFFSLMLSPDSVSIWSCILHSFSDSQRSQPILRSTYQNVRHILIAFVFLCVKPSFSGFHLSDHLLVFTTGLHTIFIFNMFSCSFTLYLFVI